MILNIVKGSQCPRCGMLIDSFAATNVAKKTSCTHCGASMYLITADVQFAVTVDAASAPAVISIVPCIAINNEIVNEHRSRLGSGLHDNSDDNMGIMMAPVLINPKKEQPPTIDMVSAVVDTPIVRLPPPTPPPRNPKPLWKLPW